MSTQNNQISLRSTSQKFYSPDFQEENSQVITTSQSKSHVDIRTSVKKLQQETSKFETQFTRELTIIMPHLKKFADLDILGRKIIEESASYPIQEVADIVGPVISKRCEMIGHKLGITEKPNCGMFLIGLAAKLQLKPEALEEEFVQAQLTDTGNWHMVEALNEVRERLFELQGKQSKDTTFSSSRSSLPLTHSSATTTSTATLDTTEETIDPLLDKSIPHITKAQVLWEIGQKFDKLADSETEFLQQFARGAKKTTGVAQKSLQKKGQVTGQLSSTLESLLLEGSSNTSKSGKSGSKLRSNDSNVLEATYRKVTTSSDSLALRSRDNRNKDEEQMPSEQTTITSSPLREYSQKLASKDDGILTRTLNKYSARSQGTGSEDALESQAKSMTGYSLPLKMYSEKPASKDDDILTRTLDKYSARSQGTGNENELESQAKSMTSYSSWSKMYSQKPASKDDDILTRTLNKYSARSQGTGSEDALEMQSEPMTGYSLPLKMYSEKPASKDDDTNVLSQTLRAAQSRLDSQPSRGTSSISIPMATHKIKKLETTLRRIVNEAKDCEKALEFLGKKLKVMGTLLLGNLPEKISSNVYSQANIKENPVAVLQQFTQTSAKLNTLKENFAKNQNDLQEAYSKLVQAGESVTRPIIEISGREHKNETSQKHAQIERLKKLEIGHSEGVLQLIETMNELREATKKHEETINLLTNEAAKSIKAVNDAFEQVKLRQIAASVATENVKRVNAKKPTDLNADLTLWNEELQQETKADTDAQQQLENARGAHKAAQEDYNRQKAEMMTAKQEIEKINKKLDTHSKTMESLKDLRREAQEKLEELDDSVKNMKFQTHKTSSGEECSMVIGLMRLCVNLDFLGDTEKQTDAILKLYDNMTQGQQESIAKTLLAYSSASHIERATWKVWIRQHIADDIVNLLRACEFCFKTK